MEKKIIKFQSDLFKKELTIIIDPALNKLKGKVLAPKKLEKANQELSKIKDFLPK